MYRYLSLSKSLFSSRIIFDGGSLRLWPIHMPQAYEGTWIPALGQPRRTPHPVVHRQKRIFNLVSQGHSLVPKLKIPSCQRLLYGLPSHFWICVRLVRLKEVFKTNDIFNLKKKPVLKNYIAVWKSQGHLEKKKDILSWVHYPIGRILKPFPGYFFEIVVSITSTVIFNVSIKVGVNRSFLWNLYFCSAGVGFYYNYNHQKSPNSWQSEEDMK